MASSMVRHLRRIPNCTTGCRMLSHLNTRSHNTSNLKDPDIGRSQSLSRLNICQMPLTTSHEIKQFLTYPSKSYLMVNQHKVTMETVYSRLIKR